jgi:hypothetical protein
VNLDPLVEREGLAGAEVVAARAGLAAAVEALVG